MSLFSFLRNNADTDNNVPPAGIDASTTDMSFRSLSASVSSFEQTPPLDNAIAALMAVFDDYLPLPGASLPAPTVAIAGITERSAGLGNRRGTEIRGSFPVAALKGIRLDAAVRFQLWAATPNDAETAMSDLKARLMIDRNVLWTEGVLKLTLASSAPPEPVETSTLNAWRTIAEYRVLYEFRYEDSDGAESLIARIPIAVDQEIENSPERETTVVTDAVARWDNDAAAPLVLRGPLTIGGIAALTFVPGPEPTGTVVLTRTFDGAAAAPTLHADLTSFLTAVGGDNPERHAQISFASVADMLNALGAVGDPTSLGDWDEDGTRDNFQTRTLQVNPAIRLTDAVDRFEMTYQHAAFDQVAVIYLRVT
ncbi:MAG: hypothetical protein ACU84J_06065 [Gammaproteobacteria bacterium]